MEVNDYYVKEGFWVLGLVVWVDYENLLEVLF